MPVDGREIGEMNASVEKDIEPFAAFIVYLVEAAIQGKPIARKM